MAVRVEVRLLKGGFPGFGSRPRVSGPEEAYRVCADLAGADRERFHLLHLDPRGRMLGREEIAVGSLSTTATTLREVFKGAILANASAIVMVHNHPSGDPEPSPEDLDLTRRVAAVGAWLGIPLLDHVVVGDGCWQSLAPLLGPEADMLQRSPPPDRPASRAPRGGGRYP